MTENENKYYKLKLQPQEKMEILVKLLLSFSIIVFNMIKLLFKTFLIKIFAQINVFKKV